MSNAPATTREFTPEQRAALVEKHGLGGALLRRYGDASEVEYRLATYGRVFGITRQALVTTTWAPSSTFRPSSRAPPPRLRRDAG